MRFVEKYFRAGQATDDIWCMRIACRMTKATNTNSKYVILIAFPLQQLLQERAVIRTLPVLFGLTSHIRGISPV
jgi:hypothetical protein